MTKRQAKKIVKKQIIRCKSRYDGPADIVTGGCHDYPEETYRKALIKLQRRMNRETMNPTAGSIERCAEVMRDMTRARLALFIGRLAA